MSGISLILWQMMKRITMMIKTLVMLASYMPYMIIFVLTGVYGYLS